MQLYFPQKGNVVKTNDEDPIDFYYYPLIGYVYKKRLANTLDLVEPGNAKLLDVGYGSGLLFPSLAHAANELYGLENHGQEEKVYQTLAKEGLDRNKVFLQNGSILAMPYQDSLFDYVVSVSTLEHIKEIDQAMAEIARVLKPGGKAALSFPVRNVITDWFYKLFGYNPREIHPSSHTDIINAAKKYFDIEKIVKFPNIKNIDYSLYCSIKCVKK